jgi:hypothetical protein
MIFASPNFRDHSNFNDDMEVKSFVDPHMSSFVGKQHFNSSIIIISYENHFQQNVRLTKLKRMTGMLADVEVVS